MRLTVASAWNGEQRIVRRQDQATERPNRLPSLVVATMQPTTAACHHSYMRATVLIVDDHADFRAAARALLDAEGFDVVGEAADGDEAIEAVSRLVPQVVLLDIQLPGLDGLTVAELLAQLPQPPAVVLVS